MVMMSHNLKAQFPTMKSSLVNARSAFTIIELSIVVGIMGILLAIALPTVKSIRLASERKKASIQATLLTQAVIKYKDIYGFWPGQLNVENAGSANPTLKLRDKFSHQGWTPLIISRFGNSEGDNKFEVTVNGGAEPVYFDENYLYRALNPIDPENENNNLYLPNPLNPRQIEFVELDNVTTFDSTGFEDPWGQEFIVFMGLNPRSRFTYTYSLNGSANYRISVSNCTAFAFSRGPDGSRSRKYIMAAGVSYEER
jgi:prepilin-type N-terminal cleavage/methylation domain-containing protein